jgi:diguanylate cyclase (GGDEF)-like protein
VARYGGDEFIVLVSTVTRDEDVDTVRDNILEVMGMPFEVDGELLRICASLGVSRCPQDGEDFRTLLKHADAATYQAKSDGRAESRSAWRQVPWRSE